MSRLEGLVFQPAGASAPAATTQPRIAAEDLPLLDAAFLHSFDSDLDKPLTFGRLADMRRAVVERYRAAGKPLVDVYVPEQDVEFGRRAYRRSRSFGWDRCEREWQPLFLRRSAQT